MKILKILGGLLILVSLGLFVFIFQQGENSVCKEMDEKSASYEQAKKDLEAADAKVKDDQYFRKALKAQNTY